MLAIYIILFLSSLVAASMLLVCSIIEFGDKNYIPAILLAIATLASGLVVIYSGYQLLELMKFLLFCIFGDTHSCRRL